MLERLGYRVVCRTSSIEALELFKNRPDQFDLVITDMTMPNLTGDKLTRQIMGIRPDIPVILCTGFSEQISEESAKNIGHPGIYPQTPGDGQACRDGAGGAGQGISLFSA